MLETLFFADIPSHNCVPAIVRRVSFSSSICVRAVSLCENTFTAFEWRIKSNKETNKRNCLFEWLRSALVQKLSVHRAHRAPVTTTKKLHNSYYNRINARGATFSIDANKRLKWRQQATTIVNDFFPPFYLRPISTRLFISVTIRNRSISSAAMHVLCLQELCGINMRRTVKAFANCEQLNYSRKTMKLMKIISPDWRRR